MDITTHNLVHSRLFAGIPQEETEELLECVHARTAVYGKNETVIWEGGEVNDIGIVLSGRGQSEKTNASGKTVIITLLEKGSFIGVLLAASKNRKSPVTVRAVTELHIMFIPFDGILNKCARACPRHSELILNCFDSIAEHAMHLHERIDCLIRPTVREKIAAYLTREAGGPDGDGRSFTVPLDRSAMADYLNVDRSALSRELSAMKKEGLIDYYKSSFVIKNAPGYR